MTQLKINLIILDDRFHSELEVAFVQISKIHIKIPYEFQWKMFNVEMYSNLQDTTEIMVRGSKLCHVQNMEIRTQYSHITTFVHVISLQRRRSLHRTGHEGPEGNRRTEYSLFYFGAG